MPRCCATTASRCSAGQQVVVRSTTLASPLLLALQRALLEREAWPLLRVSLPGQEEAFWAAARDVHLDGFAPLELVEAEQTDASITIHAPENTRALSGVDPSLLASRRPRSGAGARGRAGAAVVRVGLADAGAGAGRGHVGGGLRRVRRRVRCSSIVTILWLRGASSSASQARLVERLAVASELRIEGEGTDLSWVWRVVRGSTRMGGGTCLRARCSPGRSRPRRRASFGSAIPSSPRGVRVSGVSLEFRDGVVVSAHADEGDDVLQAMLATDDGARRLGEIGIGTNSGIDRAVGHDPARREDRRHRPPRPRPLVPGDRRHQRVRHPLGPHLRPPPGGRLTADGEPIALL